MNTKTFTTKNLKSGYVVETRDGSRFLVTRVNQEGFIKVIANKNRFINLNAYDENLRAMPPMDPDTDIVKVWGLSDEPLKAFCISDISERPILWKRPKELLNCKICITNKEHALTVGKIYEIKNGFFVDDEGDKLPLGKPLETVEDLREYFSSNGRSNDNGFRYGFGNIDFVVVVED